MADCCKATICSECFLQLQDCKMSNPCPFCNNAKMTARIAKSLDDDFVRQRDTEEQQFIEASIKAKFSPDKDNNPKEVLQNSSFGSNLSADLESRCRSRTLSSDFDGNGIVAMAPEERRKLEEEMSSQSQHPLVRKMTADAERERDRHELEYQQRRRERSRNTRRQLEQLMGFSNRGGLPVATGLDDREREQPMSISDRVGLFAGLSAGDTNNGRANGRQTIDDLLLLEAALLLNMREEASRRTGDNANSRASNDGGSQNRDGNDGDNNGRSRRSRLISRRRNNDRGSDRDGNPVSNRQRETESFVQALLRQREFEQRRNPFIGYPGRDDNGMSPQEALLADLSEARQLEMAIQLSLQEAQDIDDRPVGDESDDRPRSDQSEADYDGIVIGEQADHGEEEIVFDQQEEASPQTANVGASLADSQVGN